MKIFQILKAMVGMKPAQGAPVGRVTQYDPRQQPTGLVQRANVERVHGLLEAADNGDPRDLFALYQEILLTDSHLQSEFSKRKLALLGDPQTVAPKDKKAVADVAAADAVREMIDGCEGWVSALLHLLDSTMWPVAVLEKVYEADGTGFRLRELVPVPDQLLDFTEGRLRLRLTDERGVPTGSLAEVDAARYIVHRGHPLTFPDHRGGPLRSLVFWWLLTTMDREWWARFLDRYGSPFLVGKYEAGDEGSRSVLERAFHYATKIGGLVTSKETEVEIQQAMTGPAADAFEAFYLIGQREKSKLIVGQTLSAEAQPTGLGAGTAQGQEQVRQDIRQWDGMQLANTLKRQLFGQFCAANRLAGAVPCIAWGGEDTSAQAATGDLVAKMATAGYELTDDGINTVSERLGLPFQRKAPPVDPLAAPGVPGEYPASGKKKPAVKTLGARRVLALSAPSAVVEADVAIESITTAGSADLARGLREARAAVGRAIALSTSREDLERRLALMYGDWPAERLGAIIERALLAYAADGASVMVEGRDLPGDLPEAGAISA